MVNHHGDVHVFVANFRHRRGAAWARSDFLAAQQMLASPQTRRRQVHEVAIIEKDHRGRITIDESGDLTGKDGAVLGGLLGGLVGLIAGPALVVSAALGAVIVGAGAALHDAGIDNQRLELIGRDLAPDSSALVTIIDADSAIDVELVLNKQAPRIFREPVGIDIDGRVEHGVATVAEILFQERQ